MSCVFGPYQVRSLSFPNAKGTTFVDMTKTRQIAIISSCDSTIAAPCDGAVAVSQRTCEETNCNMRWYECPNVLGRTYALFPTPCGVAITSFEDGLLSLGGCSSASFGSSTFCFGRIYTSAGEFSSDAPQVVSFEFDGHTFVVEGTSGDCNEFLDCGPCSRPNDSVTAFASLPTAPPETADEEIEAGAAPDNEFVPETEIVPTESRTVWHNVPAELPQSPGTRCDDEVNVTSWETPGIIPESDPCVSSDNPSIVTLPSGHIIIAYEDRDTDGLTQIKVAILASSVRKNIRYYRRLSKGTLINNPDGGQQAFEIFEEINISDTNDNLLDISLSIGFLSGPLSGARSNCTSDCLYRVQSTKREISSTNRIKYTLFFDVDTVAFPDQNNIHDVSWFLTTDVTDGDILPNAGEVITVLNLPPHVFPAGSLFKVPVSNPSIAVADNNQMISEQNIYIVYQAFEENQWRIYLRQIVLGGLFNNPPIYNPPYRFDNQTSVAIMDMGRVGLFSEETLVFDRFTEAGNWTPYLEFEVNGNVGNFLIYEAMVHCGNENPFPPEGCFPPLDFGHSTCRLDFGATRLDDDPPLICAPSAQPAPLFTFNAGRHSLLVQEVDATLSMKIEVKFSFEQARDEDAPSVNFNHFPEIWFLFGQERPQSTAEENAVVPWKWRIRINKFINGAFLGAEDLRCLNILPQSCSDNCFLITVYDELDYFSKSSFPTLWSDNRPRQFANELDFPGDRQPRRRVVVCADSNIDWNTETWNMVRVETYIKGRDRIFKIYSNGSLVTCFQEQEYSVHNFSTSEDTEPITTGRWYGWGYASNFGQRVQTDSVSITSLDEIEPNLGVFYEDLMDYYGTDIGRFDTSRWINESPRILRYLVGIENDPNTAWASSLGYEYKYFHGCKRNLDSRYLQSGFISSSAQQFQIVTDHFTVNEDCVPNLNSQQGGRWAILKIDVPADLRRNGTIPFPVVLNVTFYASISRGVFVSTQSAGGLDSQWPNVWFLMRQDSVDAAWHSGWRLRVRYYRKFVIAEGISQSFWRLSVYDGDSSSGDPNDVPVDSIEILASGTSVIVDHTPNLILGANLTNNRTGIPYYKVDIIGSAANNTTQIKFSVANKQHGEIINDPSELDFTLVHTFIINNNKHFGAYYGLAMMSGAIQNEFLEVPGNPLFSRDFRAQPILNYVQLRSFDSDPSESEGACCRSIGVCQNTLESNCPAPDVWNAGVLCEPEGLFDCNFILGASCRQSDGACLVTTESGVPSDFGTTGATEWVSGLHCDFTDSNGYRSCPGPTGACCLPSGACVSKTELECQFSWGGNFNPLSWTVNADCSDVNCAQPPPTTGACCLSSSFMGCVSDVSNEFCSSALGDFQGNGTDCNSCLGACCHSSGCDDTFIFDCLANFSSPVFSGNNTTCADITCGETVGACCYDDGSCGIVSQNICSLSIYSSWTEGGTCIPNTCAQPSEACCDPFTGICTEKTELECQILGHTFIGGSCSSDLCEQPFGACCIDLACSQRTESDCASSGGLYFGNHTQCLVDHCISQDPYIAKTVNYKPEDLWVIQTGDNSYVTRVLYHMQEEEVVSIASGGVAPVDFMFMVDHSNSMAETIEAVSNAVPDLASSLIDKGLDARFALAIFARGIDGSPSPLTSIECFAFSMFDGLQGSEFCTDSPLAPDRIDAVDGAWTRSPLVLQEALRCWGTHGALTVGYAAIQFAIGDFRFNDTGQGWREDALKFIFVVTDTRPTECTTCSCPGYDNNRQSALDALITNNIVLIPSVCTREMADNGQCIPDVLGLEMGEDYISLSRLSGWTGPVFVVTSDNYTGIFEEVVAQIDIDIRKSKATIMERASSGTEPSFLKPGKIIITYDTDLSDLWSFNKDDFKFQEPHAPFPGTSTKSLSNFPFDLASGKIYGIDPVHIQGIPSNWVAFGQEGPLLFDRPNVGTRESAVADPLLISINSTRPKVFVNNRNQVIVAYENYDSGLAQIQVKGTGDFHQNSVTGPKGDRIQRFYVPSDFSFKHAVTLEGEGVNQLCDFVIDNSDITHITWQSNRDGEWEIYYANSSDLFTPVRLTKSNSRSSAPSIDVEESGSIFVVYHDNRFGPFEIMLGTKAEERIPALLEQDAYMASMRNNYAHYTNTIPAVISNPISAKFVQAGQLWGSKVKNSPGNDNENYVYKLSQISGLASDGGDSGFSMDHIAFHPDGRLYGIRVIKDDSSQYGNAAHDQATLYLISDFTDSGEPKITTSPSVIGDIDLETWDFPLTTRQTGRIIDIDFDPFGRLWVHIWNRAQFTNTGEGSGQGEDLSTFKWIDATNASVKAESRPERYGTDIDFLSSSAGFSIDSNNNFYIAGHFLAIHTSAIYVSPYPLITNDILDPSGPELAIFGFVISATPLTAADSPGDPFLDGVLLVESMTFNEEDHLLIVTTGNDLFSHDLAGTEAIFLAPLSTDSHQFTGPLPVGTTASISFVQTSTGTRASGGDFFHILVEFYDNFAKVGKPFLVVDSRENLEAFVTDESARDDPYQVTGMDARGVFLEEGQTGIVFFDATQFRPGFPRQSVPYSFEPNQTYFPKVFSIDPNNATAETVAQNSSFSCSKCSRFGTNNFDSSGCSYSFVATNASGQDQWYNFHVDFYADIHKQHLLRRFELIGGNEDLQYVEVDNQTGVSQWETSGLRIASDDAVFVQVYPSLDASSGFLCGINYTVQVNQCFSTTDAECSDFVTLTPNNWDAREAQVSEQISTDFTPVATHEQNVGYLPLIAIGLDMHNVGGKIAIAYRTTNNNLAYITYDGLKTWTNDLVASDITNEKTGYVSLTTYNGLPSLVFAIGIVAGDNNRLLRSRRFNGSTWEDGIIFANATTGARWSVTVTFDETDPLLAATAAWGRGSVFYLVGTLNNPPALTSTTKRFSASHQTGDFLDAAMINNVPHIVFWRDSYLYLGIRHDESGVDWDLFQVDSDVGFSSTSVEPVQWESSGRPAIVELSNGIVAVAYIRQNDATVASTLETTDPTKRQIKFTTWNSVTWTDISIGAGTDRYNKSLAMEIINGHPYIAYTIDKGSGVCDLKIAIYNGSEFRHETIAENISAQDPQVDIIEFQSRAAVTITASPLMVYLQRKSSLAAIDEISSSFFCECSSKIFPDRMVHLAEVSRWEASAHGYSDTRVTESPKNSLRPKVVSRSTGAAIIVWEDNNCDEPPCIKAATFRNINQDQLRSSGTGSWYDFDFNTHGQHPDLALDVYDRAVTTYEKPNSSSAEGFFGTQSTKEELPTNIVFSRVCDFDPEQVSGDIGGTTGGECDITELEANVVTVDEFISSKIVKKIRVKDEFVQYYTYNAAGRLTAVVSGCEIILEINGTPEIVAVRLRNENQITFGSWCPWSPQVGDFVMEKQHKLSANTGIKEVCVQAMTYIGVTIQFCIPIIADYETAIFETKFYRNTFGDSPINFQELDNDNFTNNDSLLEELPLSSGLAVANLAPKTEAEIDLTELVILVEIIPNEEPNVTSINYDLLQQGADDTPNLEAIKGKNNKGKITFRGFFTIKREDKVLNIDGLARVSPKFPKTCDEGGGGEGEEPNTYNPDQYNVILREPEVEITEATDVLESYRQDVSGRVGVDIDVRSQEDPHFVFGDPNYSLRQRDGEQSGVPLGIPADIFGLGLGIATGPCVNNTCPSGFTCFEGNCIKQTPGG